MKTFQLNICLLVFVCVLHWRWSDALGASSRRVLFRHSWRAFHAAADSNSLSGEMADVTQPRSSPKPYSRRSRKPKIQSKFSSVPFLSDSLLTEINTKVLDSFAGGQIQPATRANDVFNPNNKSPVAESLQPAAGGPVNGTTKRTAEPTRRSWTPTPTALRTTVSARSAYTIINQRHIRSTTAANLQTPFTSGATGGREHWQLELEYDYLAPSALLAIHMPPLLQREHRNSTSYLRQWWNACSKWGLFSSGPLADHHRQQHQQQPPPIAAKDTTPYALLHEVSQQHAARVIAIGDVHGCIEELIDLLRAVELRPGDAVVFLGDLVTKGPQSEQVIRLAMDIGAVAVRGNHDEEVCHQYRKLVQQQAAIVNVTSDTATATAAAAASVAASVAAVRVDNNIHRSLARQLAKSSALTWLMQLPYLIRSNDLGVAFVHAGVHPQRPLLHQEKHVLLTIRSLDNGVATPRCLVTQPWAADWRGPLTIYYGHDAVRGFQRYPHAVCTDTGNVPSSLWCAHRRHADFEPPPRLFCLSFL